ncbi:LTA synthase family protein [Pseudidiomarina gelatinasegens]|jgi:phosphoglycerol transferase MdoB-like AlkP superfamily enzyme|uniref:LTA synthase family protein n=1 Tax=Pseudidiomarina gelatinasegens TaxID=2487740 RepID=A0A443Z6J2_9GAMM|nr:LTA synthase family protein [Pseudidiomarina gelatinasegens]OZB04828.1 MAG: sulfatase [Idiomarina sp. 34-48-12]RWU12397.1 LTA synthase family protein [Pseudidiomarina gelatinasegens]
MSNTPLLRELKPSLFQYRTLIAGFSLGLIILSISRLLLFIWQFDRVTEAGNLSYLMLMGLRADIVQMGYLTLPLLLFAPLFLNRWGARAWQKVQSIWLIIAITYITFMEISTPAFVMQYDLRPNRLFIEYLEYPKEVLSTLWGGFKIWLLLTVGVLSICLYGLIKLAKRLNQATYGHNQYTGRALIAWPLLMVLVFAGVRSTLAHRPANPAFFAVTSDALVNSLVISSAYSLEYAIYSMRHEENASRIYGDASLEEILNTVRAQPHLADKAFPSEEYPTVHFNKASRSFDKPKNIVVILEESLGATFVEDLGGINVTPNLQQLRKEGWWFQQLYATGTRSVRGIEAVISSFLPTPGRSTVKLSLSQQDFYTAADLLSREGYFTEFLYGGETHFDNMGSFFASNGFQSILGQSDIDNPKFVGSWGASDEDLFDTADKRFEKLAKKNTPFFSLVFTSSNHEPFEFPDDEVELYSTPKNTVENAVKYADFALGKFIDKAKTSNYWEDTIFLIVADHDTRVYGNELVPIQKFRIPGLILGGSIQPKEINEITSQIDLMPTVISLAGISAWTPAIGQDISNDTVPPANRAMMQFGNNYAWMTPQGVAILTPGEDRTGRYNFDERKFVTDQNINQRLRTEALAHALLPSWLYQHRAYFVPERLTEPSNE